MKCQRPECKGTIIIELDPEEEISVEHNEEGCVGYLTVKCTCEECKTEYLGMLSGDIILSHIITGEDIIPIVYKEVNTNVCESQLQDQEGSKGSSS